MARFTASRWGRLGIGAAIFVAGAVLLVARPGVALAHHIAVTESASCAGWDSKAEYVGGPDDRKVVVNVTIHGEHIAQTFYFDNDAGHLGHQNYYLLYERTGTGTLVSSGSITMYERTGNGYTNVVSSGSPNTNLVCAATSTPTTTSTATSTPTPPPATPTSTPVAATSTPQSTATTVVEGSTPLANTPTATSTSATTSGSATPLSTDTATPVATSTATAVAAPNTSTPVATSTSQATGRIETPGPQSTPTLVSIVHSSSFPEQPVEHQSPASPSERALPSTGQGARTPGAILAGLLGTVLAAIGLGVCATGLRTRGMP